LTRGPYLQSVTTDNVIVVWNTDQLATSHVNYGPTTAYSFSVNSTLPLTHHALTLTGLAPDTVYHYQIASNGQPLSGDNAFRTADSPTQSDFSFVAFGDTRTGHSAHQSVVDRIVALGPDFVLHTGDFVNDGTRASEWTTFFAIEQNLLRQAPLFGVLGNHEKNSTHYFDAFHLPGNEQWYSFDYGNAHFVALRLDGYADYTPGSTQYAWLENDLANTNTLWKIVFLHPPLHSSGRHGGNRDVRSALGPLFADYGVDLVFSGHDHDYERSIVGNVVYIVTGGGGAPLYEQENSNPYSVYFASIHHCVSISINDRTLTSVGVEPNGTQFDPFTLHKPIPLDHLSYLPLVLHQHTGGSTLFPPVPLTDGSP
jgi:predicted phosphodiesterase